jgi:hypothetical protein
MDETIAPGGKTVKDRVVGLDVHLVLGLSREVPAYGYASRVHMPQALLLFSVYFLARTV